ncbi:MAG: nucleotide sugar dehydrogenase [Candidatus Dormibacteraeota bacterium]|nr:nucleotide sugar dehydrogenase [Candidatus Dormibacteraeota bacterium]
MRIAVVGLGKLGACVAASFAYKGFTVCGVDVSPSTVARVNEGAPPVFEPGLEQIMAASRGRFDATLDYGEAVRGSEATFIVVPTPSDENGAFSLRHVTEAARSVGRALRESAGYHVVVLTSTVLPGGTGSIVLPILEQESGKSCGRDFGLCYSPEFIALGTVIRDFLNPDFVLIGESDPRAGTALASLYRTVCDNRPEIARMNLVNAELAKIAVNTFVTLKISFANMLAALAERIPACDVDVVTSALGLDSRIGSRYLKGGVGYGGPCFPRDNRALAYMAVQLGERALLAEATDAYNQTIVPRLAGYARAHAPRGGRIAVLGVSYKPGSNVVEASQGLELARLLAEEGFQVAVFDPLALDSARRQLGDRVTYLDSLESAVGDADVAVIVNPDPAFRGLQRHVSENGANCVLIDAWRLLRGLDGGVHQNYVPLGIGPQNGARSGAQDGVEMSLSAAQGTALTV